jgi:hypothetical protein
MGKLKPNRKSGSSSQSIDHIAMIINENWDEIWSIVQQREQTAKEISRQNMRRILRKCSEFH